MILQNSPPRGPAAPPNRHLTILLSFGFGAAFLAALLVLVILIPAPSPQQFEIFRIVIAVAVAGIAAAIPGFLELRLSRGTSLGLRAGGALAVFVIVYFYSPAHWLAEARPTGPIIRADYGSLAVGGDINTSGGDITISGTRLSEANSAPSGSDPAMSLAPSSP